MKNLLIILLIVAAGIASAQRPASKATKSTAPASKAQVAPSGLASDAPATVSVAPAKAAQPGSALPSAVASEATSATSAAPAAQAATLSSAQAPGVVISPKASEGK